MSDLSPTSYIYVLHIEHNPQKQNNTSVFVIKPNLQTV